MAKEINLNDIQLIERNKRKENFGDGVYQVITKFDIVENGRRLGIIETLNTSLGLNYVTLIKVNPSVRSKGISTYVLKKYFKGYFISAGNPRVTNLYNRIGKSQDRFNSKENKLLAQGVGMWGTWRIK